MAQDGEIGPIDLAIFADTQAEPAAIYRHLEWLRSQVTPHGPRLHVCTAGNLRADALEGRPFGEHYAPNLPVFLADETGRKVGIARRHCTASYKVRPIEHAIRSELLGLRKYQHYPKDVRVIQLFGISIDEAGRASRIASRVKLTRESSEARFPLIEEEMTRADCVAYLNGRVPHEVPRSACTFCPFHNDREWVRIKQSEDWQAVVEFDHALRKGAACANGLRSTPYLHATCKPIDEVEFSADGRDGFNADCEGGCGL